MRCCTFSSARCVRLGLTWLLALACGHVSLHAQPASRPDDSYVAWDFAPQLEVRALIDFVAQQLDFGVFYDQQVDELTITIRTSERVAVDSLLPLLESVLRMKGLALVNAELPGWKRLVTVEQLASATRFADTVIDDAVPPSGPVTEILRFQHIDVVDAVTGFLPFMSTPEGAAATRRNAAERDARLQLLPAQNAVLITDFVPNIQRIKRLLSFLDVPQPEETVAFVALEHAQPQQIVDQLSEMLPAASRGEGTRTASTLPSGVRMIAENRSQRVVLIGDEQDIADVQEMIKGLDIAADSSLRSYAVQHLTIDRFEELLRTLFDDESGSVKTAITPQGNSLVVQASARQHQAIAAVLQEIDVPRAPDQSRVRIHQLSHTTAIEVLTTLQALKETGNPTYGPMGGFYAGPGFASPGMLPGYAPYLGTPMGGTSTFPGRLRTRDSSP